MNNFFDELKDLSNLISNTLDEETVSHLENRDSEIIKTTVKAINELCLVYNKRFSSIERHLNLKWDEEKNKHEER